MNIYDYNDGRSSHIPVLSVVPKLLKVKRVLELGYGDMSTNLFLDRKVYKDLELLDSYENNSDYAASIKKPDDHRFNLHLNPGIMCNALKDVKLSDYDLCFIDDSTTLEERVQTIKVITDKPISNTLIVMHDFEHLEYQTAINKNLSHFSIHNILPHTGIIWSANSKVWSLSKCYKLENALINVASK